MTAVDHLEHVQKIKVRPSVDSPEKPIRMVGHRLKMKPGSMWATHQSLWKFITPRGQSAENINNFQKVLVTFMGDSHNGMI